MNSAYLFIHSFIYSLRHRGSKHYTTNIQNKTWPVKIFEVVLGCRHQLDKQCQKYRH